MKNTINADLFIRFRTSCLLNCVWYLWYNIMRVPPLHVNNWNCHLPIVPLMSQMTRNLLFVIFILWTSCQSKNIQWVHCCLTLLREYFFLWMWSLEQGNLVDLITSLIFWNTKMKKSNIRNMEWWTIGVILVLLRILWRQVPVQS